MQRQWNHSHSGDEDLDSCDRNKKGDKNVFKNFEEITNRFGSNACLNSLTGERITFISFWLRQKFAQSQFSYFILSFQQIRTCSYFWFCPHYTAPFDTAMAQIFSLFNFLCLLIDSWGSQSILGFFYSCKQQIQSSYSHLSGKKTPQPLAIEENG